MLDYFFSQTGVVLFSEAPSLEALQSCFPGADLKPLVPSPEHGANMLPFQGQGFTVVWNERTGESAEIDIQNDPWPDDIGDTPQPGATLAAASLGAFGAGASPGGMSRAVQQAWHWPGAAAARAQHQAFVRIRLKGFMLRKEKSESSSAITELDWLLRAAGRVIKLPGALAWYNPTAELLTPPDQFSAELAEAASTARPPVDVLCSPRIWNHGDWAFVDTVGMRQFHLPDFEFAGLRANTNPRDIVITFKNLSIYLIENGDVIQTGNSSDGPAGKWRAMRCKRSGQPPNRTVLRWTYENAPPPPPELAPREPEPPPPPGPKDLAGALIEMLSDEVRGWQQELPLYRAALSRFRQTPDYQMLAVLATEVKDERQLEQAMQRAVLIPSFPAIGNSSPDLPLRPALVIGTFDIRLEAIVQCALLADKMGTLYGEGPAADPADRALQEIVKDDRYVAKKRVLIPEPAAHGVEIYAFNVLLSGEDANPSGASESGMITPLLASPGPGPSPVVAVPMAVLQGKQGPGVFAHFSGQRQQQSPPPLPGRAPAPAASAFAGCKRPAIIILVAFVGFILFGALHKIFGDGKTKSQKKGGDPKPGIERVEKKRE